MKRSAVPFQEAQNCPVKRTAVAEQPVRDRTFASHGSWLRLVGVTGLFLLLVSAVSAAVPDSHGMTYFPSDHVWNVPVDNLPVKSIGTSWIKNMIAYSVTKCG